MFTNLKISTELLAAFSAVILTFAVVGGVSLWSAAKLERVEGWNTHSYQVLDASNNILASMINMETGARGFLLSGDESFLAPWQSGIKGFQSAWSRAKELTSDNDEQQRRLVGIEAQHQKFARVAEGYIAMRREVDAGQRQSSELIAEFVKARDKVAMDGFRGLEEEFSKSENALLAARTQASAEQRRLVRIINITGSLLAVAIAAVMGLWVSRSITRPIREAVTVAERVAAGDLTVNVSASSADETGQLLRALDRMVDGLRRIVAQVREGSDSIATGSSQIAVGNADLSQRTEEQASALQQTAATMEQLNTTVGTNAECARQASNLAQDAASVAVQGGDVMGKVVSTMQGISEGSREVSDITSLIDGIAFQTNILALNAAVEAARAGEQGRGFAVVASEVRTLARRSADAAKEIKTLIGNSGEQVERGMVLVDQAGKTMNEIVRSIGRVNEIVSEITTASVEQSAGIQQVGNAVDQMDQVTQQNAALVEQSAAAAQSLKEQAQQLVQAVAVFKLSQQQQQWIPDDGAQLPAQANIHPRDDARIAAMAAH